MKVFLVLLLLVASTFSSCNHASWNQCKDAFKDASGLKKNQICLNQDVSQGSPHLGFNPFPNKCKNCVGGNRDLASWVGTKCVTQADYESQALAFCTGAYDDGDAATQDDICNKLGNKGTLDHSVFADVFPTGCVPALEAVEGDIRDKCGLSSKTACENCMDTYHNHPGFCAVYENAGFDKDWYNGSDGMDTYEKECTDCGRFNQRALAEACESYNAAAGRRRRI